MTSPAPSPRGTIRDFAIVGAATGFGAPFGVLHDVAFSWVTGLGGALGGVLLGAFTAWFVAGPGRRWPSGVLAWVPLVLLGMALGAAWGAVSVVGTGLTKDRGLFVFAAVVASLAGAAQGGWLWAAYCHRALKGRSTRGLVWVASMGSFGVGFVGLALLDGATWLL